jgi:hypothetical protein
MGLSPEGGGATDENRRRLQGLIRTQPGVLMNVMEMAASAEDKVLVRNIVDAAFFIFSGAEDDLPGGRDFWERMRQTAPGQGSYSLPAENARARELRAFDIFRREVERYASTRPQIKRLLDDSWGTQASPAAVTSLTGTSAQPASAPGADMPAILKAVPAPEEDAARLSGQPEGREAPSAVKELEDRLALQEEEARMAREDLANMEKKYHENLELLKAEAHDRGELQKRLTAAEGEVSRAQARLGEEERKVAETRSRLERKEAELEKLGDQLHGMQLELVKKEEEIKMAMEHLRDEEAERRRVLEALRQEAREKAQMEHRLKKREQELERLETRIQDEEKRIESLKGSQAVSEEQSHLRSEELRRREDEIRALEAQTRERVLALEKDEELLKKRISDLKQELRAGETVEAQLRKREEMRAALEARYRAKEDELVKELMELERAKVMVAEREKELAGTLPAGGLQPAPPPLAEAGAVPREPPPQANDATRNDILDVLSKRIKKK